MYRYLFVGMIAVASALAEDPALPSALILTKLDSTDPVLPGAAFDYTLEVNNPGATAATNVTVTDSLPTNLLLVSASSGAVTQGLTNIVFTLANVGAGATVTLTVRVQAAQSGLITNRAVLVDGLTVMSAEQVTYALSSLRVTVSDTADPVRRNETFRYLFAISNAGPVAISNLVATDTLPGQVAFVSAAQSAGSNTSSGATVLYYFGELAAGAVVTGAVEVTAERGGILTNRVLASGSIGGTNLQGLGEQLTQVRGAVTDLNGDGLGDLLMMSSASNQVFIQAMNGTEAAGLLYPMGATNIAPWQFAASSDIDGDGTADLVARSGGIHLVAFITSGTVSRIQYLYTVRSDLSPWYAVAGGDFNGDGFGDLLFQRGNASLYAVVLQQNNRWTAASYLTGTKRNIRPWRVMGAADTDGDGISDLVLQRGSSGVYGLAMLDGWTVRESWYLMGASVDIRPWVYRAGTDLDGDGYDELVFQNTTDNTFQAGFMDGYEVLSSRLLFTNGNSVASGTVIGPR